MLKQQHAAPRKFTRCLLVLPSAFGVPKAASADRACLASKGPQPEMASQCCREFVRNIAFAFGFVWVCGITYPIWGFRNGVQPIDISPIALGHDIRARSGSNSKAVEHAEARGESPAAMIARYRTGVRELALFAVQRASRDRIRVPQNTETCKLSSARSGSRRRGLTVPTPTCLTKKMRRLMGISWSESLSSISSPADAAAANAAAAAATAAVVVVVAALFAFNRGCQPPRFTKKEMRLYKCIVSNIVRSTASPRPPALPTGRHPRCHCIDRGAPRSPTDPRSLARDAWIRSVVGCSVRSGSCRSTNRRTTRCAMGRPAPTRPAQPSRPLRVSVGVRRSRAAAHAAFTRTGWISGDGSVGLLIG